MLSSVKIAGLAKAVAAKALTAKALVGVGMLAGSAATGLVAYTGMPTDYRDSATGRIDPGVSSEAEVTSDAPSAIVPTGVNNADTVRDAHQIRQVIVTGSRMKSMQRLAYDIGSLAELKQMEP